MDPDTVVPPLADPLSPRQVQAAKVAEGCPHWEHVLCPLCQSGCSTPVVTGSDVTDPEKGMGVVQCQECQLCYTNPRPSPETMARYYPPSYPPHQPRSKRTTTSRRPGADERHHLPPWGQRRLLDFGCGNGSFLERMQAQGWEVTGIDTSTTVVERLRSRGFQALVGTLPHPDLEPDGFDMITMWQSLEHVHDPLRALEAAHVLLRPGGKLLVSVPNLASLSFACFGRAWFGLDLPRHLTHFTPQTLKQMLIAAGFRPGPVRLEEHSSWVRASAAKATGRNGLLNWKNLLGYKVPSRVLSAVSNVLGRTDSIRVIATR
jgi:2-polyprenyl-3-methyl-5-hydroxy-6-metoxy-1,4-benzoquinol methylase